MQLLNSQKSAKSTLTGIGGSLFETLAGPAHLHPAGVEQTYLTQTLAGLSYLFLSFYTLKDISYCLITILSVINCNFHMLVVFCSSGAGNICVDYFLPVGVSPPVEIFTDLATGAARLASWLRTVCSPRPNNL